MLIAAGSRMSLWLPINKNLWTSSYALFTGGMASMLFGALPLADRRQAGSKAGCPLVVFGVNPIAVYVLSMAVGELLERMTLHGANLRARICETLFTWWAPPEAASLLFAVSYVAVWLGIMEVFYRKRIFIKL